MASHPSGAAQAARPAESAPPARRVVRTAAEARQGEIILGRRGRWM